MEFGYGTVTVSFLPPYLLTPVPMWYILLFLLCGVQGDEVSYSYTDEGHDSLGYHVMYMDSDVFATYSPYILSVFHDWEEKLKTGSLKLRDASVGITIDPCVQERHIHGTCLLVVLAFVIFVIALCKSLGRRSSSTRVSVEIPRLTYKETKNVENVSSV